MRAEVKQMIVAIDKMDYSSVMYGQARYDEIKEEVTGYHKNVGYKASQDPLRPYLRLGRRQHD
jgi:elongation factor 1-alpha